MRHLHAIADAQDRDPRGEDRRITAERPLVIDTVRTTAENDALDIPQRTDLLQRHRMRMQLRIHMKLTNSAGNQLVVLTAEI